MHVLVTGASGFIGERFVAELKRNGHDVTGVVRRLGPKLDGSLNFVVADMGLPGWTANLPAFGVDAIVHLAQSRNYRDFPGHAPDAVQLNVAATVELAKWAISVGARRFVFSSSGTVYAPENRVHEETDTCAPSSYYGVTKLAAEFLLRPFAERLPMQILRLFAVYGPGQTNAMIPNVIGRFRRGDAIQLAKNIGVRINPVYIDDCVRILGQLVDADIPSGSTLEVLNVAGGETIDLREVADILATTTGKEANIEYSGAEPAYLVGSRLRLQGRVDLNPETSFSDGLRRTLAWLSTASGD